MQSQSDLETAPRRRPWFFVVPIARFGGVMALVCAWAGCDLNFTEPSEELRNLAGTYSATFVFTNRNPDGSASAVDCDGTFVITEQQGDDLTGTLTKDPPCLGGTLSFTARLGFGGGLNLQIVDESQQAGFSSACVVPDPGPYHGAVLEGDVTLSRPYDFTCSSTESGHGAEVIGASPR